MLTCKILNSLEKVFPDCEPKGERVELSMLKGETASFQIAVKTQGKVRISVDAEGFTTRIRRIVEVPVNLPVWPTNPDTDYLRRTPGLFPDVLREMPQGNIMQITGWWRSFWVDVEPLEETCGGDHKIKVKVERLDWDGEPAETYSSVLSLHYVAAALPPQKLIQTKWFHADCLADYYHVDVFSEDWWRIVENFVSCAVRMGINMILTPIITPALDTYVGGERTTVQLIDVRVDNGKYSFNFDLLKRWVDMCLRCGVEYFEIAHLYSQWGAKFAPKVMATVDGEYRRIFGWETPALGGAYKDFLAELLPQLDKTLKEMGIAHRCRFHVSDEPHEDALDHYTAVRDQAKVYLKDYVFMDALSHFDFYKAGAVDIPVVASDSGDMQKFLDSDIKGLWIYYCCGQSFEVSNGFIAMPSQRTRILGTQLYLYGMGGFLQWG
ncbi:MAG: hypothetical protein IKZ19_03465 [Clostridia bacterium]|nr:hypothetical protein [Clostridia bacterium]